MDNYIYSYYQKINDGSIGAGRWIHLLYDKIVTGIEDGEYVYDGQKAGRAIRFIETFCRHNKGKLAPGPFKLSLWEKAFISCLYGIVDETGKRNFREVALFVGRKCGKTLIASAIMVYETYVDGEFGSEIYCVAPKLDQTDLVFSAWEFTKDANPDLQKRTRKQPK
jgi:phage terminase large subunit-like protein